MPLTYALPQLFSRTLFIFRCVCVCVQIHLRLKVINPPLNQQDFFSELKISVGWMWGWIEHENISPSPLSNAAISLHEFARKFCIP